MNKAQKILKKMVIWTGFLGNITYQTKYGFKINLNLKNAVDRGIWLDDFEQKNIDYFNELLRPDMTVIDIGANIGLYTLLSSVKVGKNGAVHSFEPSPNAFNKLYLNLNLNKMSNVIVNKMGVSDQTDKLKFHICSDDAYNSLGKTPMLPVVDIIDIEVISLN